MTRWWKPETNKASPLVLQRTWRSRAIRIQKKFPFIVAIMCFPASHRKGSWGWKISCSAWILHMKASSGFIRTKKLNDIVVKFKTVFRAMPFSNTVHCTALGYALYNNHPSLCEKDACVIGNKINIQLKFLFLAVTFPCCAVGNKNNVRVKSKSIAGFLCVVHRLNTAVWAFYTWILGQHSQVCL